MENVATAARSSNTRDKVVGAISRYERMIAGSYRKSRHALAKRSPRWLRRYVSPFMEYFDLFWIDHGVFRSIYSNTHQVTPDLWRSSQPAPYQIRRFAQRGIRTIVNMRGLRDCGSYRLAAAACARHGIKLVNFPLLRSRAAPGKDAIWQAKDLFEQIEYPALVHCKSGADRVGLLSGLYLVLHKGLPIQQAAGQLDIRYGHIKQARTGILDRFFEQYDAYNRKVPTPFLTWVDTVYDPSELQRSVDWRSWAIILVDWILCRE
jgi:protein tyrosine/serine phosphatase